MQTPLPNGREKDTFAIILTQHRTWGSVLAPIMLERMPGRDYFSIAEALSPFPNQHHPGRP